MVNTGTGSFKLRGVLENAIHTLWPGQYVNVQVKVKTIEKAIVCPASAIQTGAKGEYAIVVKDGVAEFRDVTVGGDSMGLTIVTKGLSKGEKVITENVVFIRPGSKVVEKTKKKDEEKKPRGGENESIGSFYSSSGDDHIGHGNTPFHGDCFIYVLTGECSAKCGLSCYNN